MGDWFAQNAPQAKPAAGQDWFASNAPKPTPAIPASSTGVHPTPESPDPSQPGMRPYQDPMQPLPVAEKAAQTLDAMWEGVKNGAHAIPSLLESLHDGHGPHEIEKRGVIKGSLELIKKGFEQLNPIAPDKGQGGLNRAAESFGTVAGGAMTADLIPSAPEAAAAKRGVMSAADMMKKAPGEVMNASSSVAKFVRAEGKQASVVKEAMGLPMKAINGAEDIFRAAAPTGKNVRFRENIYAAAHDLADIARKIDLSESKGGIVNPDMRLRSTVDAISSHLDEMYQQERVPQIQAHAGEPVSMRLGPDATEGLAYLKRSAGETEVRAIAAKALEEQSLTLFEADRLAKVANQNLKGFESMTAADRAQASMTNRRLGGLKELDRGLGRVIDDTLKSNGEVGIRGYERRFAALSEVRDQLSDRINATELKQDGIAGAVGKVTQPLAKLVTGGKSGIASASQAAVADVNIGKRLQDGLKKLKDSGISAKSQR